MRVVSMVPFREKQEGAKGAVSQLMLAVQLTQTRYTEGFNNVSYCKKRRLWNRLIEVVP
jgi:hypothetical protein